MKALMIGDYLIPPDLMAEACTPLQQAGYEIETLEWKTETKDEVDRRRLQVELYGPEADAPPARAFQAIQDAEILIVHFCPVTHSLIEAGRRLKVIGVSRAGWENINVKAATQKRLPALHIVGRNDTTVAEFALGLMLVEMRHIARAHHGIVSGNWFEIPSVRECFELGSKTIGLVGFGAVGRVLARRLAGFDVRLLVHDPHVSPDVIREAGGEPAGLDELLRAADIVSLHARLTDGTIAMIDERELALMKRTAYLINTARAGLINEQALIRALQVRQIAGAALDVFWKEPIPADSPLLRLENVTLTSHIAGTTHDSFKKSVGMVSQAALDCISGANYDWVINLEVLRQEI